MAIQDFEWRYSGVNSLDAAQAIPSDSIGNYRSSTEIWDFQSQATAATTSSTRRFLVDSTRIGDGDSAHRGKTLTTISGGAYPFVTRILYFQSSTGTFFLQDPFPDDIGIGDYYRVWAPDNLFPQVTAQQCADGFEDWRTINILNGLGVGNVKMQFWLMPFASGGGSLELLATKGDATRTDFLVDGGNTDPMGVNGAILLNTYGQWNNHERMRAPVEDYVTPHDSIVNNGSQGPAIILHRIIPPGTEARDLASTVIMMISDETGGDPDPLQSVCPIIWSYQGFTPSVELFVDQKLRVNGGCRIEGRVTIGETGIPVEGRDVTFELGGGDPGSIVGDPFQITDDVGIAGTTYQSPSDEIEVGNTVNFNVNVGGGDELV